MSNFLTNLAKLRQFSRGTDSIDYLQNEMRQNLRAIEEAFKNTGKSFSNLESSMSLFAEYSGENASQTIASSGSNQQVEIVSVTIPTSARSGASYVIQTKAANNSGNPFLMVDLSGGGVQFYQLLKVVRAGVDIVIYKGPSVVSSSCQPTLCFITAPGDIEPGDVLKLVMGLPATHGGGVENLKVTARALPY